MKICNMEAKIKKRMYGLKSNIINETVLKLNTDFGTKPNHELIGKLYFNRGTRYLVRKKQTGEQL